MKILIVNADDFGKTKGINQGIIRAHTKGIVTSTSVMSLQPYADEARNLNVFPKLSVGLHFDLSDEKIKTRIREKSQLAPEEIIKVRDDFQNQIAKFQEITGRKPDHIDSHYQVHLHDDTKSIFKDYSDKFKIPLRHLSGVNCITNFFAGIKGVQKTGEGVSPIFLIKTLSELKDGIYELMCHPGIVDEELQKVSSYSAGREKELETLTNPQVLDQIRKLEIQLKNWQEIHDSLYC